MDIYIYLSVDKYSRACGGSYHEFLERGLFLTGKLLNQGFLVGMLKSHFESFMVATITLLTVTPLRSICVTNDHGHVSCVVITILSFPHS